MSALGDAVALRRAGRFDEASRALQRCVGQAPDDPAGWVALVDCELAANRAEVALQVAEAALRRLPDRPALLAAKARVLRHESRVAEAAALFARSLALDPGDAASQIGLAALRLEAGDVAGAEATAAPLLARSAGVPALWLGARIALAKRDYSAGRERLAQLLATPGLSTEQAAEAALALGEALDGLGHYPEAFANAARGKAALRSLYAERAASRESAVGRLERLAAWFGSADPEPWRAAAPGADMADVRGHAFLVGFPRSGTTLLEQALAGHPDLVALEEAPTLAGAHDGFMTSPEGLERLAALDAAEAAEWRARYWTAVRRSGVDPRGKVFLDKAPAGTLDLPLVAKLFPRAKVLFALRDPRDVVLSAFRNHFQMNSLTYAFTNLEEAARAYAATMALAEVYRAVLPTRLEEVRYETLIRDFPGELERIAALLGLEVVAAMLDVGATAARRSVRTPSGPQVRAGLNRSGLGRWRDYDAQLAPALPILAPWIGRLGYGGEG